MDYIKNNNKKYMLNQSGLANPYKNINLEILKEREAALVATHSWWEEKIYATANKLKEESEKLDSNWEVLESLQRELEHLQLKGEREEAEVNKFLKIKNDYLMFTLMSGISEMNLNYK